jgi:hypothetical protein
MIDSNPCNEPPGGVTIPTICRNDLDEVSEPHEPPIGLEGGSLYMSWNLQIIESTTNQADPRPYKYVLADSSRRRGDVAVVKILTERNDGQVSFARYLLPQATGAHVLIWLQKLISDPSEYPPRYENRPTDAQILIRGDNLFIETDRRLNAPYATYKLGRRHGYAHPGYERHFRIAAWAIVDETGHVVHENNDPFGRAFNDSGDDGYYLYIYFHH